MVLLRCLQTQGNAGPHSFVGLLFSFQRPSRIPRPGVLRSGPSPYHRGVAKTSVLAQEGAAYLLRPLRTVKRKVRRKVRAASRPEEPDFYIRPLRPVKHPGEPFRFAVLLRGALLLSPRRVPRQEGDSSLRISRLRGARYVAPPRIPVNNFPSTSFRAVLRCLGPSSTGRAL